MILSISSVQTIKMYDQKLKTMESRLRIFFILKETPNPAKKRKKMETIEKVLNKRCTLCQCEVEPDDLRNHMESHATSESEAAAKVG